MSNARIEQAGFLLALIGGVLALVAVVTPANDQQWAWTGLVVTVIGIVLVLVARFGMTNRAPRA